LVVGELNDLGPNLNHPGPHLQLDFFESDLVSFESDLVLTEEPLVVTQDANRRRQVRQNAFDIGQALFVIHCVGSFRHWVIGPSAHYLIRPQKDQKTGRAEKGRSWKQGARSQLKEFQVAKDKWRIGGREVVRSQEPECSS
jgi:hypothetical protein